MTEAELQRKITDLCDWLRLKWHHETDSRKSKRGFPDLVIAGPGGVVFAELKGPKGKLSKEQAEWLAMLLLGGTKAYCWFPEDWPEVEATLYALAGRKLPSRRQP
jgi:hypothetical protein